jgi:hypothetical protein
MTEPLDLDAITARAAIRPGALLTALRCIPGGEIRHGCVISDGGKTKDAIRAAYHVVHKDVPALVAEVRRLQAKIDAANWCDCGIGASKDGLCDNSAIATTPHSGDCPARDRVLAAEVQGLRDLAEQLIAQKLARELEEHAEDEEVPF